MIVFAVVLTTVWMMFPVFIQNWKANAGLEANETTQRRLFEAYDERLHFRAVSSNIRSGSSLHKAIMADVGTSAKQFQQSSDTSQVIRVDLQYELTAKAGPIMSVLRKETLFFDGGNWRITYASTLQNRLDPNFLIEDVFQNKSAASSHIRFRICQELASLKPSEKTTSLSKSCDERISGFDFGPMVFSPSSNPNLFNGLTVYLNDPDHNKEPIEVAIPSDKLKTFVRKDYQDLFE